MLLASLLGGGGGHAASAALLVLLLGLVVLLLGLAGLCLPFLQQQQKEVPSQHLLSTCTSSHHLLPLIAHLLLVLAQLPPHFSSLLGNFCDGDSGVLRLDSFTAGVQPHHVGAHRPLGGASIFLLSLHQAQQICKCKQQSLLFKKIKKTI